MTDANPQPWTAQDVERWLVVAYRCDPRERSPGVAEAIAWVPLYVWKSEDRAALHTWAWAKAGGHSISEVCQGRGWSRATFERRRAAAVETIVAALNRRDHYKRVDSGQNDKGHAFAMQHKPVGATSS